MWACDMGAPPAADPASSRPETSQQRPRPKTGLGLTATVAENSSSAPYGQWPRKRWAAPLRVRGRPPASAPAAWPSLPPLRTGPGRCATWQGICPASEFYQISKLYLSLFICMDRGKGQKKRPTTCLPFVRTIKCPKGGRTIRPNRQERPPVVSLGLTRPARASLLTVSG